MENEGDWTCDANDAVNITIVQSDEQKLKTLSSFHPQFTYPIFGDDEQIFGYKGLIIRLRFAAHDLRPHLHISYDEKFKPVGDTAASDLLKILKPWVSEEAFCTLPDYEKAVLEDKDGKDFKPPGKLVHSYTSRNRNYEIWAGSLADADVRRVLDRAQVFVSLFIEAGTPLDTDDPEWTLERWTVYFVYEKVKPPTPTASQYSIVGYSTTYRWWYYHRNKTQAPVVKNDPFPPSTEIRPAQLPARLRIAQFLILPPHQNSGHGRHLYTTIHSACIDDPTVEELTVEDPNEAFDVLRDSADYQILRPEFLKHNVNINPDPYEVHSRNQRPWLVPTATLIPVKLLHDIRKSYKIDSTQFAHILEMFLLGQIPLKNRHAGGFNMSRLLIKKYRADDPNERRYYWWRMLTKQRLYKRSKDILIQLDLGERIQKLEETVTNVEEGYEVLLKEFTAREQSLKVLEEAAEQTESRATAVEDEANASPSGTLGRDQRVKRKFTVEDDDEDEAETEDTAKRTKV
ncbi:histone acetyltransferase catalytic subunit HAT1 [Aspergillus clavatus NRRL 1]|uniref:Histone acetyltransferase type B catalytic subunit n=1 Tax=Aspergillus clavatus (strain ATCC 1007 / CBS 513.65 / DSM 816 / NCTC 3887 / NRRL 1 / QM 1276 / 107) TaxID=344612 RepID=A1C6N8_ASPCL|nr:histone acetyltransferase type b catalytic subunit, putative [Aspergillus clavatus NRRL 1]EAW14059.1 histone acetyltransferase type b catalytic subunit, putative [Aspergillus clavatus NRRL 1]